MATPRSAATNLLSGTITRYILLGLNIGIGLFLMPFTVAHLGKAQYGLWMLVTSVTYYFSLLDLGYDSGLVRNIVQADARGDELEINKIISTFVCVYSAIGLAACALTILLVEFGVPRFPHLSSSDVATARAVLAIVGLRIAVGFPMTVFGAVTTARQGFVLNNCVAMAMVVMNGVITYVVLTAGGTLVPLVFWTTLASLGGYVAYAWTARHVFPGLTLRVSYFSRALWRDVTTFSVYMFVIDIASQITFNIDNVLIGAFLGTAAVAVYAVAVRLFEYQRRLCDQFSGILFPVVVGIRAGGDVARLRMALVEGTRVAVILVTGVTICLVGFSGPLIVHWMGPDFAGSVAPFLILAMVGVIIVAHASQSSVLLATGKHRLVAAVWTVEAAVNFLLSVFFVRRFGAVGVALGTAIPIAIGHLGVLTPAACRRVKLSLWTYASEALTPAVVGAAPAIVLCLLLRANWQATSTLGVLAEAAIVGVVYMAVVATFGIDAHARRRYRAHVANLRSSFALP